MSHGKRVGQRARGLVLGGLLCGCAPQSSQQTEVPDGPSEAYEAPGSGAQTFDPTAMTDEEAEQAAKVAAAKKVMQKVKDRDPEEEKKKMAKSRAISTQARAKLDKRAHDDAVKTAREALKIHEQNVDAMLVIAEVYYKQGKYELTRAVASSALQVDAKTRTPEDTSRAYNLQGFAMLAMGEDNAATQSFKKAAEADENNAAAWNNLGTRYLDAGDITTATSCFKYAIELDPRFFKAQLNYGASLRAEHKWQEAEKAIRKSLELRPNYAEAYFNLGVLYLDADPFPGLDTTKRLNKAIQNLGKYQDLARGSTTPGPSTPGLGAAGSAQAPPPRVSKERADDYIRVAKKGLEREARRLEREKGREATGGAQPAGADAGAESAVAGDAEADAGAADQDDSEPIEPSTPTPQGPGGTQSPEPSTPAPKGPGTQSPEPSTPAPQGPAKPAPSKPAPSKPAPSKPAPQGPSKPAPSKPAPQGPSKPAPSKPAPQGPSKPAPSKPTPPGPAKPAPKPPSPQKPTVQKPQSASWNGRMPAFKKVPVKPASRGTRWSPSTLNSMEAGVSASSCVDLVLTSLFDVVSSDAYAVVVAHGHRSLARSDEPLARRTPPLHPLLG